MAGKEASIRANSGGSISLVERGENFHATNLVNLCGEELVAVAGGEGREVRSEPVTTARRDIRWQTKERRR